MIDTNDHSGDPDNAFVERGEIAGAADGPLVAVNIDTGCVSGGALSAVRLQDGARASVPAVGGR